MAPSRLQPKKQGKENLLSLSHLLGTEYNPKQAEFILATEFEVCYCGGMGAGKSFAACVACLRHALRFPGARILIARSTEEELLKNPKPMFFEIVKNKGLLKYIDPTRPKIWDYKEGTNYVRFTNGSEVIFSGLYGTGGVAAALDNFKNVEYSLIFIDQLEELEDYFELYELLLQRCRYSAAPPEERHVLSVANDEGDTWIRRRFLTYELPHIRSADPLAQRKLIRGSSWENPHLDAGARAQLRAMPSEVQARYVYATMDPGASRLIPTFKVVEPIAIPSHWPRWCGIDPARSSGVTCAEWVTVNPDREPLCREDGTIVVPPNAPHFYSEYWAEGREAESHAEAIMGITGPRRLPHVMDHSAWHESARSKKFGSITVADFYIKAGVPASPSTGDEWTRLQVIASAHKRGLTVSSACTHLIAQAPQYRVKGQMGPTGPIRIVAKSKFHAVDAAGYALSLIPTKVAPVTMGGSQLPFTIGRNVDEVSKAHWELELKRLPRESKVTMGFDEIEFNREDRDEVEGTSRPADEVGEEDLQW